MHSILCNKVADGNAESVILKVSEALSNLEKLHVSREFNSRLEAERLLRIGDLKSYKGRLYIQRDYLSNSDMEGIGNMKGLTELCICCRIEPGSLFHLRKLKNLRELDISCSNKLSTKDYSEVKNIKGLGKLKISTCYYKDGYTYSSIYSYTNDVGSCMIL